MNTLLRAFSFCLLLLLSGMAAIGQNFTGIYTFANVTNTSGRIDPTPVPVANGVLFGSFQAVGNMNNNPNSGGRFNFAGWPTTATINTGAYFEVIISPQSNYDLTLSTLTFTIQRSGTGVQQFSVRHSADNFSANLPASFAGTEYTIDADNVFKVVNVSGTTGAVSNLKINLSGVTNSASPDTIRIYGWGATGSGGTFSLNRAEFAGTAVAAAGTPALVLDTNSLRFPSTPVNTTSPALAYNIKGTDLTGPVTITAPAPFLVSDASAGTFASTLTLAASDVAALKTVYVKFAPVLSSAYAENISNSSPGAASLNVAVSGQGVDPANLSFNFNTCTSLGIPGGGFTTYSVTGAQGFACSTFGNNSTNGVDINGYSSGAVENEDWLITPPLAISGLASPVLSFYSRGEFTGPTLQILLSTDYNGYGNPNSATWTDLQASFAPLTNTWTLTDGINLSAYKPASRFYLAFKYTSSPDLGAARWTLDDINITDRTKLLSTSTKALNFGEISSGNNSPSQALTVQGFGYGAVTVTAPAGYQVSVDNTAFAATAQLSEAAVLSGAPVYTRFSPTTKSLKLDGIIRFAGAGLDSGIVSVTGSSYPKAETFDAGAYNLSFFGSNSTNNPTPQKITTQINNIATVFQHINLDVVGVEEVSSDSAMGVLVSRLPGYAYTLSNRWSYSFNPPDPTFPPQKVGFVYNTSTMQLVDQHVMFEGLFDSLRNNQATLPGYPDSVSHFWSSGRLPFMATFNVTVAGTTKQVRVIDIHAKSSSDVASYNRRVYDARLLKDSLDLYYAHDNIILVGDYNDRVYGSIYAGGTSPYRPFVTDTADYSVLTYPLDSAGKVSFISGTGLIDQIIISDELKKNSIAGSTDIEDARTYISGYNATTASDHLPIYTRMTLTDQALPVKLTSFTAEVRNKQVVLNWKTAQESNNDHFTIERSADGQNFAPVVKVAGVGTSNLAHAYQTVDSFPLPGVGYYRVQQVDFDGKSTTSGTVAVKIGETAALSVYPNPVQSLLQINGGNAAASYVAQVTTPDGRVIIQTRGNTRQISQAVNQQIGKLKTGMYILNLKNGGTQQSLQFLKQ